MLDGLEGVPGALDALTRARQALEQALRIIDINHQALSALQDR